MHQMGSEKGVRDSFFEFFGEEGITFQPHPIRFRELARKNPLPEPPPPRQFKLEWWPVYGDVALSGDIGYNTGPTLTTDLTPQNRPARHGYFFSVWKRLKNGTWRVAVDMGTTTPAADPSHQDRLRYVRARQLKSKEPSVHLPLGVGRQRPIQEPIQKEDKTEREEVMALETEFLRAASRDGYREAYLSYLDDDARVHRPDTMPLVGRSSAGELFQKQSGTLTKWEAIDGGVAVSGELGYTYGAYELKSTTQEGAVEKGYFTRVWKRDPEGKWKIVADVVNPLPPRNRDHSSWADRPASSALPRASSCAASLGCPLRL